MNTPGADGLDVAPRLQDNRGQFGLGPRQFDDVLARVRAALAELPHSYGV